MRRDLIADSVNTLEQGEFQSFVTYSRKENQTKAFVSIPKKILDHLQITKDDILEVAIRKVPLQYARDTYGVDFVPFYTVCPKCNKPGRFATWSTGYAVFHSNPKYLCYLSKKQAKPLIQKYYLDNGIKQEATV